MTPILETTAVALVYILLLQPFYLLEILPFWGFLEEEKKKPFCRAWVALTVAETALTVGWSGPDCSLQNRLPTGP
ncbi:hypothetical protein [Acidaminococcus massiliensis]|uniref:hypothetical protein n=1 Tax=Acidaminococcus massiliensis TaxID=1852375 RepID=UPI00266D67E6|nr:hypothetical protein [Acidaminococcus massiliensis]